MLDRGLPALPPGNTQSEVRPSNSSLRIASARGRQGHAMFLARLLCRASGMQAKLRAAEADLEAQRKAAELASRKRDALAALTADLEGKVG